MERRNSISGRLSLSTTNLTNPIAESTHINGSSVLHSKFPWGGKIISPQKKSEIIIQRKTPKVQMTTPISKIDPRVYIDAQSNGLASRIVKYHENNNKLNRSFSTGSIYNKPGQFPIVHLKKKEIIYKPNRNTSVSMVRIAPPDKSIFQANTRSSILRTGSIVPTVSLLKGNEQVSRENRPILHPAGNDIAPTRSVLDALREISRKRINSDELDSTDNVKKYCKEQDEIATNHDRQQSTYNSIISKRQREGTSPLHSMTNTSPEQISKKRLCSRNNDVTSSLSSSLMMITPKRKLKEVNTSKSLDKLSKSDSPSPPKSKQQCNDSKYVPLHKIETNFSEQVITPVPPTPAVESVKNHDIILTTCEQKITGGNEKSKPKLTLFNKNYDETPIVEISTNSGSTLDDYDLSGVKFVKPKNNTKAILESNPLIERTKKSKLALMLSGLSGELNEDDIDAGLKKGIEMKETLITIPATTLTPAIVTSAIPTTSSASISFETKTTISTTTIPTTTALSNGRKDELISSEQKENPSTTQGGISSSISSTTQSEALKIIPIISNKTTIASGFSFPTVVNKAELTGTSVKQPPTSESSSLSTGFNFGVSKATTSPETVTTSNSASSIASQILQSATSAAKLVNMPLNSSSIPAATLTKPTIISPSAKTNTSVTAVNWSAMSSSVPNQVTSEKISFTSPISSGNKLSLFGTPTTSTANSANPLISLTSPSKPAINFASSVVEDKSGVVSKPSFGLGGSFSNTVSTGAPTFSNSMGNPLGNSLTGNSNIVSPASNTNTSFIPATSAFTHTKSSFNTSGGFSFKPPTNQTVNANILEPNTSFSNLNQTSTTTTKASVFAFNTPPTSSSGGFSFSSTTTGANISVNENKPSFSFGVNNSKPSSGFSIAGTVAQNKLQNPLGTTVGVIQQQNTTSNSTGTESTTSRPNPFSFGVPQNQQQSTTNDIFGLEHGKSKATGFAFNNSIQSQNPFTSKSSNLGVTASTLFGAPTTTANSFGVPTTTENSFGAPITTENSFGTPITTANSFGTPIKTTNPTFGVTTPSSSNIFGTPNTTSNTVFSVPKNTNSAPAFGIPAIAQNLAFDSTKTENKPVSFFFGSSTTTTANTTTPTKSFSFGENTSTPGFAFNATSTTTENKNLFSSGDRPTNTFSFGQSTITNNTAKPMFGVPAGSNSTSASHFNSSTISVQPKSFNFSTGPSNLTQSINLSGTSSNNNNNSEKAFTKSFNFTTGPSNLTPSINLSGTSSNNNNNFEKAFSFGASNQQNVNNSNNNTKSFNFGGSSSNPSFTFQSSTTSATGNSDLNKTFTFEGTPTKNANIPFGGSNSPAFNFAATANSNLGNSTNSNPLSVGPSSSTTAGDRVIRKATRRLK